MASLITRLLSRFKTQKRSQRIRRQLDRRLRVEHMEARRLLAGDLGAVAGNVYTDVTDDGYQAPNPPMVAGDPGIAGVTVSLFLDAAGAGSGSLGPEDGAAIHTMLTDVDGNYRFDGLSSTDDITDALYFVQQSPATGKLQRASETLKSVTITPAMANGIEATNIDNYNTTPVTTSPADLTAAPGDSVGDQAATVAGEALGGQRDILVTNTTALGGQNLNVHIDGGLLSIGANPGATGNVIVSYDGVDASATTLDHTTLGPVDLTVNGGEAFQFLVGSEVGNTLTVDVYSGGTNYSTFTTPLTVTAGGVATDNLFIPFTSLTTAGGSGVDLAAVTAIRFQVNVAAGQVAQFNFVRIAAPDVTTENFANLDPMSLGDLVFRDNNNNGLRDAGEPGIPGVLVELYEDTNANGTYDVGTDTAVGTAQTTDANGNYLFTDLLPGAYIALIPNSQFAAGQVLEGMLTSTGNDPVPDPDISVIDNDDNGYLIPGVGVATLAITLASGTEPTNDGDGNNSNLTLDFGFVPQIDLGVVKTADVATVHAGNEITYTLTVTNHGAATATNVVITDDLPNLAPDALTIVSATATGGGVVTQPGAPGGEVQIAYASLAAGQAETVTIVVRVPATAAAAAAITNTATIVGDGAEPDPDNNSNTDSLGVAVTRQAVLTLTKTDAPDPSTVGGTLTYEILVTNTGPSTADNVVVSDTLPPGLTFVSSSTTAGIVAEATGVITATIPTLAPSASATVTIVTTIQAGFAGSTIPNSATAQADDAVQVAANATTFVNPDIDLQIIKTDSIDPVNRGSQLTYTLTVTNAGPSGATNVEVVDTLPTGVTFASSTGGTITSGGTVGSSGPVTFSLGAMASGAVQTITLTVDVAGNAPASISNTAIVRSTESIAGFDRDMFSNSDTELTATRADFNLAVTKTGSPTTVKPGEDLVYTIVVTNQGPSDATSVSLTDNLPDGIRVNSATSTVGTVTIPASAQDTIAANNDDLIVAIPSLPFNGTATIIVNATVLPGTTGTLSNVATVSSTDDPQSLSATATTTLTPEVDLKITKTDSADPAIAGNPLTYTITVTNAGPSTATNVMLNDTLPTGLTFTSVTSTQGTVTNNAGVITGNLGTLEPNGTATITLVTAIDPTTRGPITNTASVQASEPDATNDNSASQVTQINGSVGLVITKTDSVDPVLAGGQLSYTILVTNNGPSTATNVVVTDTLPSSLVYVSGNSSIGTVTNVGNAVTASVGALASGASATITVNTTVAANTTAAINNTALVTATENAQGVSASQTTQLSLVRSISGFAYLDFNKNGIYDTIGGDTPLAGVDMALSGVDSLGAAVNSPATSDATGAYTFDNLRPGIYQIVQTQPKGYKDGQTNVGTGATGVAGVNEIDSIVLTSAANGVGFNFGEYTLEFSKRLFLASYIG